MASKLLGGDNPGWRNFSDDPPGRRPYIDRMDQLAARVDALETDVRDIKATLGALSPKIIEIHAVMTATVPHLATKAELSSVEAKLSDTDRRLSEQIGRETGALSDKIHARPTTMGMVAIAGLAAAFAAVPWKEILLFFGFVSGQ